MAPKTFILLGFLLASAILNLDVVSGSNRDLAEKPGYPGIAASAARCGTATCATNGCCSATCCSASKEVLSSNDNMNVAQMSFVAAKNKFGNGAGIGAKAVQCRRPICGSNGCCTAICCP